MGSAWKYLLNVSRLCRKALRLEVKVVSMAELFYLTTRRHGGNYYVKFRLEDGFLSSMKCTGTSNYAEAKKIAYTWRQLVKINSPLFCQKLQYFL